MNRKQKAIIVALVTAVVVIVAVWQSRLHLTFNAERWMNDKGRSWMVNDLLQNYLHEGMTEQQVISLLGPPDSVAHELGDERSFCYDVNGGFTRSDLYIDFYKGRLFGAGMDD